MEIVSKQQVPTSAIKPQVLDSPMAIRSRLRIGQAELQGADSVLQSGWVARGASGAAAAKPEAELLLPPAPLPWTLACHSSRRWRLCLYWRAEAVVIWKEMEVTVVVSLKWNSF